MGAGLKNSIRHAGPQRPSKRSTVAAGIVIPVLLSAFLGLLMIQGVYEPLDRALMDLRFRVIDRAPSDTLVIVEIDPESLSRETHWPWPRDRYAKVIRNLQDAGASFIAFDVDFSSLSEPSGDKALSDALARQPGDVALPVFWQWSKNSKEAGRAVKTPPHEYFLRDTIVASVTMTTENNGVVRRGWRGLYDAGEHHASIAAVLAGLPGAQSGNFYLDYSIRPSEISRLSFHDVATGRFDPMKVGGKNVLIGATALELGDEFAAPLYGVIPGVDLHAISYESIRQDRELVRPSPALPFLIALVVVVLFSRSKFGSWRVHVIAHGVVVCVTIGAPIALQSIFPISFDTGVIIVAQAVSILYLLVIELHLRMRQVIEQRISTARYQALTGMIITSSTDGVLVTDEDGTIELFNERAEELLGVEIDLTKRALISQIAPSFPLMPASSASEDYEQSIRAVSYEYEAKSDQDLVLEVVAKHIPALTIDSSANRTTHKASIFVYSLRDISARKRIEAAEREAKEAAISANKTKSQLIANMSHELRTPLNGVIGFAGIFLEESYGALGAPEYKEFAEHIHLSGKRLLGLVNDMLAIAKLEANEIVLEKDVIPLEDAIDGCLSDFEAKIFSENKIVKVQLPPEFPPVDVDLSIFKQTLSHLVSNALKFTEEGGLIVLEAIQVGADFILEVRDNGCGVDPSLLPKLTDAFFQANADLSRQFEGAGLGLHLVSRYAELHNGTIDFVSKEGEGFTARLRLNGAVVEQGKKREAA